LSSAATAGAERRMSDDSVHRVDLERELDDRVPSGKVGDVTFDDTSHKHTYVCLYACMSVCV
jgi:hypothetical protein